MPARAVLPGVSWIKLPWTNAWILHHGGEAVLIDTGTCRDRQRLLSALKSVLPSGFRLSSVLLTHGHCDHSGNAAYLGETFGARIHAHALEVPYIATPRTYVPPGPRRFSLSGLLFGAGEVLFPVKRRPVDAVVADGDTVESPIGPLRVLFTPGHTAGHVSYLQEKEGWLFSGDALLTIVPWIRRRGLCLPLPVFSMDLAEGRRSARRIAEIGPSALLAGHGAPWMEDTASSIRSFLACGTP